MTKQQSNIWLHATTFTHIHVHTQTHTGTHKTYCRNWNSKDNVTHTVIRVLERGCHFILVERTSLISLDKIEQNILMTPQISVCYTLIISLIFNDCLIQSLSFQTLCNISVMVSDSVNDWGKCNLTNYSLWDKPKESIIMKTYL